MVPAAAVIPSLLAYVKFVAFKKLVVELMRVIKCRYMFGLISGYTLPH